jgi:hypothetical protein
MSQHTKEGCGDRTLMGHGENAICGQPYVMGIFYCEKCKRRTTKRKLAAVTAQRDELLNALKGLYSLVEENYHVDDANMTAFSAAYQAIAKADSAGGGK